MQFTLVGTPGLQETAGLPWVQDSEKPLPYVLATSSGSLGSNPVAMVTHLVSQLTGSKVGIFRWSWWNSTEWNSFSAGLPWKKLSHQPLEQKTTPTSHHYQQPGLASAEKKNLPQGRNASQSPHGHILKSR